MAELAGLNLVNCMFTVSPDYYRTDPVDLRHGFGCSIENRQFHPKTGQAVAVFVWSLNVADKTARKTNAPPLASMVVAYLAVFDGMKNVHPTAAQSFVDRVGMFASYPYFRSLVSQLSWSSGVELPVLPLLKENRPDPIRVPVPRPKP